MKFKQELTEKAKALCLKKGLNLKYVALLEVFFESYTQTLLDHHVPFDYIKKQFTQFLQLIGNEPSDFAFEPYHQRVISPIDYTQFGIDFMKPLVKEDSLLKGQKAICQIETLLKSKENVVLLANHQTEADPQIIMIMLEKFAPMLGKEMIFVAGERVTTDPLAIPFSMGCNLLCIYSKRYIDHPPEEKMKKQLHNKKTMEKMSELFDTGGKCIYVAPSGGRDRKNSKGIVEIAPFDPQSVEMFHLMARRAKQKTHFFPLTLDTYDMLPPPEGIQKELGEQRICHVSKVRVSFGDEIDMEDFPGSSDTIDKHEKRKKRAEYIGNIVIKEFEILRKS